MSIDQTVASVMHEFYTAFIPQSIQFVIALSPIFLAILLLVIFWDLWMDYVRSKKLLGGKYAVLELKLPKDTYKSPHAMEIFINSMHNTAEGSTFGHYWKGEIRPWFSLELISIEGAVKFILWTGEAQKSNLMSALYSQYPEIEVREIEDYAKSVHFDPEQIRIWAGEFELTKKDPYPIKTYVDYGLDKDPKEEFKIDPLLPLLEFLGSVGPNQQVWIQILIRAHKKNAIKKGHWFKKTDTWHDEADKLVNEILLRDPKTKVAGMKDEKTGFTKLPTISGGEQDIVEAIERSVSKIPFDVGIRAIYISKKDIFNAPFALGGIIGNMKHFSTEQLNGFKPKKKWHSLVGDPWMDYKNIRRNRFSRIALAAYKRRSYFYPPFQSTPIILNSEELATIYHFPGSVSKTPNLERVPSRKAQAPGNLPI